MSGGDVYEAKRRLRSLRAEMAEETKHGSGAPLIQLLRVPYLRHSLLLTVLAICAQMSTAPAAVFSYSTAIFTQVGLSVSAAQYATAGSATIYFFT